MAPPRRPSDPAASRRAVPAPPRPSCAGGTPRRGSACSRRRTRRRRRAPPACGRRASSAPRSAPGVIYSGAWGVDSVPASSAPLTRLTQYLYLLGASSSAAARRGKAAICGARCCSTAARAAPGALSRSRSHSAPGYVQTATAWGVRGVAASGTWGCNLGNGGWQGLWQGLWLQLARRTAVQAAAVAHGHVDVAELAAQRRL